MRSSREIFVRCASLLCVAFIAHYSCDASTVFLKNPTTAQALTDAIASAQSGDTIIVDGGTLSGNVRITKRLAIIGRNSPRIIGSGKGSVVTILADSCIIRGFHISRCGKMLVEEDAGILIKSGGNRIEHNTLDDILFGIYFLTSNDNVARNNIVRGRAHLEVGERGSGIHIWNSHRNNFFGNIISDVRDGFYIQNANHMRVEDNEVHHVRYGIHYMYADSNVFLNNKFYDNVAGAAIMYSHHILIRRNEFVRNRGFASYGILYQDCTHSITDSNIIADNVIGIFMEATRDNIIRHNIIAQNDAALQMFQNSTNNLIVENNFIDNLNPLVIIGKETRTRWNANGRGNYWSHYDGYDLDGDRIGDVPMKIQNVFQYLEGRNENLRLFFYSPVSQALAAATKAFPIIAINQEIDPRPLMDPIDLRVVLRSSLSQRESQRRNGAPFASVWYIALVAGFAAIGFGYFYKSRKG